ncbi:MAG: hypothetical protein ACP5O7_06510 [Phycisphaerae bacterium]
MAAFKDFPYFPHICQNRSWRPSAKPQSFATFNLAAFKTNQYPCMFTQNRRTQKHPFLPLSHPQTSHFTSKTQRFSIFILAAFKTAQYPCMFSPSQNFKKTPNLHPHTPQPGVAHRGTAATAPHKLQRPKLSCSPAQLSPALAARRPRAAG